MKILLTGATGYIGKRLLPILVAQGHEIICCVRDKNRFYAPKEFLNSITIIEVDFLKLETLTVIPDDIDAAFYLIHSMSSSSDNYDEFERISAENFVQRINQTRVKQVIYLSGIVNDKSLSKHLSSRKKVEDVLNTGHFAMTTLRAGIIVGSGSASFEIIRDLVNKLPVMVTPKWLNTKCQPIAINDVLEFLSKSLMNPDTFNQNFDIGGPDILTYKEMLLGFAKATNVKRWIVTIPIMTPKLSSYWLYFVTSTSYKLAAALVSSMKVEVICNDNRINELLNVKPMSYELALSRALKKVDKDNVVSSWKDSLVSGRFSSNISEYLKVPKKGCFIDRRKKKNYKQKIYNRQNLVHRWTNWLVLWRLALELKRFYRQIIWWSRLSQRTNQQTRNSFGRCFGFLAGFVCQ